MLVIITFFIILRCQRKSGKKRASIFRAPPHDVINCVYGQNDNFAGTFIENKVICFDLSNLPSATDRLRIFMKLNHPYFDFGNVIAREKLT